MRHRARFNDNADVDSIVDFPAIKTKV